MALLLFFQIFELTNSVIHSKLEKTAFHLVLSVFLMVVNALSAFSQNCPPNIDFETGTFSGWTCYTGFVAAVGTENVITLTPSGGPIPDRQNMLSSYPGNGLDPYGHFPVNCPNGSGHSIKLGNTEGGGQAEGISYEFTIPPGQNTYSLIYNYAVVFQDPNHLENEQPRMEIEITNITDNSVISCSSFTFIPYGSVLPGFELSDSPGSNTPVWYKNWSAVSINLNGNAGKHIRLFFKTADCTFRRHFGYAYIDVNTECSGNFIGAAYCPDDTEIQVVAPYGYQGYEWYNLSFSQLLGTEQVLHFAPPPPSGTTVAVILTPYSGYGCLDTLYARLMDTLRLTANAGPDLVSCNRSPVQIGSLPKPGQVYSWSPSTGLSDPNIANPHANPLITTNYIVTTSTLSGGCLQKDTVTVTADELDSSMQLYGSVSYCIGSGDSAVLKVHRADSIQWFRDNGAVVGAIDTLFRVTSTGTYFAVLYSWKGCILSTVPKQITIASVPVAAFTVDTSTQCLTGNKFIFTNKSTNVVGSMQYHWIFEDGFNSSAESVIHSFKKAGKYSVKLVVNSSMVCADSSTLTVTVNQNAVANFTFKPVCINLSLQLINNTLDTMNSPVSYLWNLSNGQVSTLRIPPIQTYPVAGVFPISLSVNTAQCPIPLNTVKHFVIVDEPKPALNYPVQYAVVHLPLELSARRFGEDVLWSPGINLDDRTSYSPVFRGSAEQRYTIAIKTVSGCTTVDTQLVKTVDHIAVYVPNAFSPDNNGVNDRLRPISFGMKQVRSFRVFNRWGQLLFRMQADQSGWDGTFKGVKLETQTVVWTFEGEGLDGNIYSRKGTSMLLR